MKKNFLSEYLLTNLKNFLHFVT